MKNFKNIIAAVALLFGVSTTVVAQETDYTSAHNFVGLQGGGQVTLTHYALKDLITPQVAFQFGRYFNDKVGARIHVMGIWNKTGFKSSRYNGFAYSNWEGANRGFKFKAYTADLDLLLNMTNIINSKRQSHAIDWILFGGFGYNYTWGYSDIDAFASSLPAADYTYAPNCGSKHASYNLRLGTQFNYNISEHWTVGVEAQINSKNDVYNIKTNDKNDWQIAALAGITYNFGYKHKAAPKPVVAPEPEPVYATRIDTTWYEETQYKEVEGPDEIRRDVHWAICQSENKDQSKIDEVINFVKTHKDVKVSVTGYADKGTGNPKLNIGYSKKRALAVANLLKAGGVPADVMTVTWKGDKEQPFAENDENRVAITVATGIGTKKVPYQVKKFRTKEVRYQVK